MEKIEEYKDADDRESLLTQNSALRLVRDENHMEGAGRIKRLIFTDEPFIKPVGDRLDELEERLLQLETKVSL